jgi:altronate dehydratase small subunit
MKDFRKISEDDNVAIALRELPPGSNVIVNGSDLKINDLIKFGHKFALENIRKGSKVIKYGEVIGEATSDIKLGDHVHIHNLVSLRGRRKQ